MLEDVLNSYKASAELINWKLYSINELFLKCIEHENQTDYESWYSGIVCRTWGYAGRIYNKCNKHIPFEQCYDILIDTINYVLEKGVWESPDSSLYLDPAAPDKAFHIVLKRQLSIVMANVTAKKRQSNFNALSIDEAHETFNDAAEGLLDIGDESSEYDIDNFSLMEIIKQKPALHILILDQICFNSWSTFRTVASYIKKISEANFSYYNTYYNMKKDEFTKALKDIKMSNNKQLISEIKKCVYIIRKEVYVE